MGAGWFFCLSSPVFINIRTCFWIINKYKNGFVSQFFSEIFPRLGIGLAVLLVIMILLGIFMPKESWINYATFGVGAIIVIVIIAKTAGAVGWTTGYWWQNNWPTIIGVLFILAVIGIIVGSTKPKKPLGKGASEFVKNLFNQ
jgi:hypothetical protein